MEEKMIIYQVFTRLFGNKGLRNKMNGTLEENGCGKMDDFTEKPPFSVRSMTAFRRRIPEKQVARDVHRVAVGDFIVPVGNERLVHLVHVGKRAVAQFYDVGVAEMQVADVVYHGYSIRLFCRRCTFSPVREGSPLAKA